MIVNYTITLTNSKKGEQSASLFLAQQYVNEFGKLAKTNNTVIMPSDLSNVNSMVTQVNKTKTT